MQVRLVVERHERLADIFYRHASGLDALGPAFLHERFQLPQVRFRPGAAAHEVVEQKHAESFPETRQCVPERSPGLPRTPSVATRLRLDGGEFRSVGPDLVALVDCGLVLFLRREKRADVFRVHARRHFAVVRHVIRQVLAPKLVFLETAHGNGIVRGGDIRLVHLTRDDELPPVEIQNPRQDDDGGEHLHAVHALGRRLGTALTVDAGYVVSA
mmetsp:Transcript_6323/g.25607  ORF Transcript_6323/g.25607 Transcript_6323/m.25607 type:complete len:214 (+) Transcript_6323:211-852(+)